MAVVMISKGSYSRGEQVAEAAAVRLGYATVAREELLAETSDEYNIPEALLERAVYDPPSFWERISKGKQKYVTYIRAALLKRLRPDNIVYHGLAGQYFVRRVPHVLKVRVIADAEDRVKLVMERDKLDHDAALDLLKQTDDDRRRWSKHLYGIEIFDPALYDIVLQIKHITLEQAAEIVCQTVKADNFATTPTSARLLDDLAIAAEVDAAIVDLNVDTTVHCSDGKVDILLRENVVRSDRVAQRVEKRAHRLVAPMHGRIVFGDFQPHIGDVGQETGHADFLRANGSAGRRYRCIVSS